jgi:hypothetical protein
VDVEYSVYLEDLVWKEEEQVQQWKATLSLSPAASFFLRTQYNATGFHSAALLWDKGTVFSVYI